MYKCHDAPCSSVICVISPVANFILIIFIERNCVCNDPTGSCIMSAVAGPEDPTLFSSCSVSDLNDLYARNGDTCLFNAPSMVVGDPVCGNGIQEDNEACDCGSPDECTNICCNATTCRLIAGAECASGSCCTSQCQLVEYGMECRASSSECDIAEYCLGDSNECPEDDHVANGKPCKSDTGYCMEGQCPTHEDQCMTFFSKTSCQCRAANDC